MKKMRKKKSLLAGKEEAAASGRIPTEASDSRWETWYRCLAAGHATSCVVLPQAPSSRCVPLVLLLRLPLAGLYQKRLDLHCGADWEMNEIHYYFHHHHHHYYQSQLPGDYGRGISTT
jgi:hypothetical protein